MNDLQPVEVITRFAPSPTGFLHLGHAYSARLTHLFANDNKGRLLLRIEDTDQTRCRPEFEKAILDDLNWLEIEWRPPLRRQSEHLEIYRDYISDLTDRGLTYPCFCTRKEIQETAQKEEIAIGPDGPLYPGTCRQLSKAEQKARLADAEPYVIRIYLARAINEINEPLTFEEHGADPQIENGELTVDPARGGDFVLARKGSTTSYHASVVIDDHLQGITDIVRGRDLYAATHIHRLLQALWQFEPPRYHHHGLLVDDKGRKLSKRDKAHSLISMRQTGATLNDIEGLIEEARQPLSTSHLDL